MRHALAIAGWLLVAVAAVAGPFSPPPAERTNRKLAGHVVDFTCSNGADNRIWSEALGQKRDLYVYLPPGYSPAEKYPVMLYFHAFSQDEGSFLDIIPHLDAAIAAGTLPPMIVAAPDGSIRGKPALFRSGSFYINSDAGRFEDYIVGEVWPFVQAHFPIRPEREAHVLAGSSMGGFGAYNLGIKHSDQFGVIAGVFPPLNLRYEDCRGRYFADFDPACWRYRARVRPCDPVARFAGLVVIREGLLICPLFGHGDDVVGRVSAENPVEMLDAYDVKPGRVEMFVGYGNRDEFNIDAQVESFLHVADRRCLKVTSVTIPGGRHNFTTGLRILEHMTPWLKERLGPYAPESQPAPAK